MIKQGDVLPTLKLMRATQEGPREVSTAELFGGQRAVMFAVPGAFTPTCSAQHLPGYNAHFEAFRARGIGRVICLAVNDAFVLGAWAASQSINPDIVMLADGSAEFNRSLGLELDLTQRGMGIRAQRFALVADDMRVTHLAVEKPGDFDVSRAEAVLNHI